MSLRSAESKSSLDEFEHALIRVIGNDHPETLEEAVALACSGFPDCDGNGDIIDRILRLENAGEIFLEKPPAVVPSSLTGFFLSGWTVWFWVVFSVAVATTVMVFAVPETAFPLVYARYLFGSIFMLFLPGFSIIKALFGRKELDNIERLALSVGLSLALVPLAGLLLNYTPWGIRTTPVTLSLLALTLVFACAAVARDYGVRRVS